MFASKIYCHVCIILAKCEHHLGTPVLVGYAQYTQRRETGKQHDCFVMVIPRNDGRRWPVRGHTALFLTPRKLVLEDLIFAVIHHLVQADLSSLDTMIGDTKLSMIIISDHVLKSEISKAIMIFSCWIFSFGKGYIMALNIFLLTFKCYRSEYIVT